jgi:hypothetical protein
MVQDLGPQSSSSITYDPVFAPTSAQSIAGDNMVSVHQGRASAMSMSMTAGSGTDKEVYLKDVVARLAATEEIVRPLQLLPDQFTTLQTTVADQQQQQAAFNIALTRVENTVWDRGLGGGNGRRRNLGNEDDDPDCPQAGISQVRWHERPTSVAQSL